MTQNQENSGAPQEKPAEQPNDADAARKREFLEKLEELKKATAPKADQPATTPAPAQPHSPNWIISETTSPVDYRPQIAALTMARVVGRPPSSFAIHRRARRTELTIATAGAWKPATDSEVKVVIPDQRRAVS